MNPNGQETNNSTVQSVLYASFECFVSLQTGPLQNVVNYWQTSAWSRSGAGVTPQGGQPPTPGPTPAL